MQLWLSKNSGVPLREQLIAQMVLGIVSNDLKAGQKLPGTRELARRFRLHANTVSSAYRELARRGWVEFRKGSGVYVRAHAEEAPLLEAGLELDQLISSFLKQARERGLSLGEIRSRVEHWLELQPPDHFLLIEPDAELRAILAIEIEEATGLHVACADPDQLGAEPARLLAGAAPVMLYGRTEKSLALLPPGTECLFLHSRSVPESLQGQTPPPPDALITVVSRWPEFLRWSRAILVAAGIDPVSLNFRDARSAAWHRGLRSSALVIADALTATHLPAGCKARIFRIVADSSLDELRSFARQFLHK